MKKIVFSLASLLTVFSLQAKTLVVYYSYTNNIERIVSDLTSQIGADIIEVEPAQKGLDYATNNYAIGSAQIAAIRNNPDNVSSYPEIDPVDVDLSKYDCVIIGAPLWWSNMAAPLQSFLLQYGKEMSGKKIGLIVSSASSGISGVESDAKRLIPDGNFISPSLWIRSSQTSSCHSLISNWLEAIHYNDWANAIETVSDNTSTVSVNVAHCIIHVSGDFQNISLYGTAGNKITETRQNIISTSGLTQGMYVAVIREASNRQSLHKLLVK